MSDLDAKLRKVNRRLAWLDKLIESTHGQQHHQYLMERQSLIVRKINLEERREYLYPTGVLYPIARAWDWLRSHPIWALIIVFAGPMIMAGPQAMAGFVMIVGTLWFLVACFRGIRRHYEQSLDAKTVQYKQFAGVTEETRLSVPGGILKIKGDVSPDRLRAIQKEWESAQRSGGASLVILEGKGTQFADGGMVIPEEVSVMHAGEPYTVDASTDGVHPRLPAWMRTAWDGALAEYRTRVGVEGIKYRELKTEFTEAYRSVLPKDDMLDWTRRNVTPSHQYGPPDERMVTRIERGLASISDEGARYGELLFRAQRGEDIRKYATEDGEVIVKGQQATASPEMPRSFIPMLDRAFELTTDCRYHHVAEHALVETAAHPGYVVRTCTICSPATFWIERA